MKRVGGLFLYAILAGFCIGLGGTVFLKLKDAFPGGNVVGALLFTIGLFTVWICPVYGKGVLPI